VNAEPARDEATAAAKPLLVRIAHGLENWVISAVLLVMIGLPLAEIVAREVFASYVPQGSLLLQNCTLIIGTLGALVAARERRMLALSTAQSFLRGKVRLWAETFAGGVGAGVALLLACAGLVCVRSAWDPNLELLPGFKTIWIQSLLPLGFLLIAVRLCLQVAPSWLNRVVAMLVAIAFALPAVPAELGTGLTIAEPHLMFWLLLGLLLLATSLGSPVFATLGGAAVLLFWHNQDPISSVAIDHYELVKNDILPTIPLFTLAGYFMAEGGSAPRIVRLCEALVGSLRGGPALVTALACAFFTTFTGASGVTILAIGGLMMPVLLQAGYRERASLGYVTGAGSLGMLFPPCLPLILYAIRAELEPRQVFLAGILPGILLLVLTAAWGFLIAPPRSAEAPRFSAARLRHALWDAKWELLVPVIALGGLFSGLATAVETSALTAAYALLVVTVLHRGLHPWRDLPRVLAECGLMVGGVILILGVAMGLTQWLIDAEVPATAVDWVKAHISSPLMFLLAMNVLMLVVGCLMDVYSAIIVVVPLLLPMARQFDVDPVHLGIIVLANLELGYLTPPIGLNLFLASYRFKKPLPEVYRAALPMIVVLGTGVLVITYVPWLTTWLPRVLGK
jgi:tripartite ATP-independent transporter DctM subunit